ncbi:MAG: hypothetical protein IIC78_06265 [Chloroflexi bacterium]|nr:hypothetical protein [Chloroflexota bacterium]
MKPQEFDWKTYKTSIEILRQAIQQMDLVPLENMEIFLHQSISATVPDSDLPRKKIKAARQQLELIAVSMKYMAQVRGLLGEDIV